MKALVLEGTKQIHLANFKTPICNPNETLLKVIYCSVCRTDAKAWSEGQRDIVLPRILGHEICGRKLGSTERFIVWPACTCNKCNYCKNGLENLCSSIQVIGFHRNGGFAQYVAVPTDSLIKVPQKVPSEIACMTELVSSAINAIEQVNLREKQKVLIYGGGAAGLMLGLACKYFGADPFVVEKNPQKTKLAEQFCHKTNIPISDVTTSNNFDIVINAAPDPKTLIDGLSKLTTGGKFCFFSGFSKNISAPLDLLNEIHYRQLTIVGAYGSTKQQMKTALTLLEKNHQTIRLLIHKIIKLEEIPSVLPEIILGQALKYVCKPCSESDTFGN